MNPADGWWGVGGSSLGQQNVSSWLFRTACMYYIHQLSATKWVPLPPRLYSPRLLIVRWPKSGTAKTVPAVPAAPALIKNWRCRRPGNATTNRWHVLCMIQANVKKYHSFFRPDIKYYQTWSYKGSSIPTWGPFSWLSGLSFDYSVVVFSSATCHHRWSCSNFITVWPQFWPKRASSGRGIHTACIQELLI